MNIRPLTDFSRTLACFVLATLACRTAAADGVTMTPEGDGHRVTTPLYTAVLNETGQITELKLGDLKLIDGQMFIGHLDAMPDTMAMTGNGHPAVEAIEQVDPATWRVRFQIGPIATYKFESDGFSVTVENQHTQWKDGFGMVFVASRHAQMVNGLPLPAASAGGVGEATFLYDDGSTLDMAHSGPGNPFNNAENGGIGGNTGYSWERKSFNPGGTYTMAFRFKKGAPGTTVLAPPPFAVRSDAVRNIFNAGDPIAFSMTCKRDNYQKLIGKVTDLALDYKVIDFFDKVVAHGTVPVALDPAADSISIAVIPQVAEKGWFILDCTLKDKASLLVPATMSANFAIVTPTPGMTNLPLTSDPDDYEMDGFLGLRCQRASIHLGKLFPVDFTAKLPAKDDIADTGDMNDLNPNDPANDATAIKWDDLDNQIKPELAQAGKYGITTFYLIENAPKWLKGNPAKMEEAMSRLVSHYKGQIHNWMLWNEPNLTMSPADYVTNYLEPLRKGAHRADPDARVMGPDTCGVHPEWLEEVYKAGGAMDIVDMHPYTGHNRGWEENDIPGAWRQVRAIMAEHGDAKKELWSTESGFGFDLGSFALKNVACFVTRQYPLADSVGIPRNHFYYYYTNEMGFIGMYLASHQHLMPAGVAARVENEQLAGHSYAGEIPIGRGRMAFRYSGPNDDVIMAWSLDFAAPTSLNLTGNQAAATDIMGNLCGGWPQAGTGPRKIDLQLSGYPIYLHVDHGATLETTTSLGPDLASAAFWADQKLQPTVTASSSAKDSPPDRVIDGIWNSQNTGSYEGKLWCADASLNDSKQAWLEIDLPQKRAIDTAFVYAPSSLCGLPGLRSYKLMAFDYATNTWRAIGTTRDNELSWVFEHKFAAITTDKVKLQIDALNNGFLMNDYKPYTDMKPRVTEIELYDAH